ncbi:PH domain-containing protein [Luteimonas sp. SX5]|uniref:PH domain-containing protein n=1 Tax=Luteimonas galliterrae TaxID=2940486 RepID=A0ABT0MJB8_9GAMM|nr:PH domain-containing protein [Luteimonas galliterrae]MCL1634950.1 PH domain-containing protein [Luteimonas galliterrae]
MTTPEPMPAQGASPERRLHPLSWLFVLIKQLKQFIVPLIALFFFGRGDRNELWPLIGVGVLALASVWQYFTYRYRIDGDRLVVRSGLLHRSLRQIPFARIHNVALHQSLLHRIFGVAEVRLESAGGEKPEAQMRVLKLSDAMALEALLRRRGAAAADVAGAEAADEQGELLLQLPLAEVLRLGLISNRGLIVVGGAVAASSQFSPRLIPNLFESAGKMLFGYAGSHHFGPAEYALAGLSLVLGFIALMRLFSMLLALLQYFGFRLVRQGRRLTVERGLLTKLRTSVPRRRIQAWTLREGIVHRLLKRRTLQIDTAVAGKQDDTRGMGELAPVATPPACDALLQHLLPRARWPLADWSGLHRDAWLRLWLPGIAFAFALSAILFWRLGMWGALGLLWLPWAAFVARQHARRAGYAVNDEVVAVREGWWSRHWRFAEIDKLQALRLTRSPLDRRFGMATVHLDTAGAGAMAPPLRIRYLPDAEANALYERLARDVARRPLRW